jgi:hypothetical protein
MSWINNEYRKLDRSPRALRRFGYLVGSVFLLLGCVLLWRHRGLGWPLTSVGAALVVLAALDPRTLKWVYAPWMILAAALGWIVTGVLLTIVFFLVVTPVGLLQRFFGKRAIEVARRAGPVSYWQARATPPTQKDYEKQF